MWVIFLLSALGYAILALIVIWIANKVINSMRQENKKIDETLDKTEEKR